MSLVTSLRARAAFRARLHAIPLRIGVTGIRGKSSLVVAVEEELRRRGYRTYAKQTGEQPRSIVDGVVHPIARPDHAPALLEETMRELNRWWTDDLDVAILENQAITPYTMRAFNALYCRPHVVLLTNIRRDHLGDLGTTPTKQARAFARSVPEGATLISAVSDPALVTILKRETAKRRVRLVSAATTDPDEAPPGAENVALLDALLREVDGDGLGASEIARRMNELTQRFSWQPSSIADVVWFPGAGINDVDSTLLVQHHLQREEALPVSYVAVFRDDRRDRTATFTRFFAEQLADEACERVYLAGPAARVVALRLRRWRDRVRVFPDGAETVDEVLATIGRECRGQAVLTVANAVPPLARALADALEHGPALQLA